MTERCAMQMPELHLLIFAVPSSFANSNRSFLEAMLPASGFLRISRSFLLATAHLRSYSATHVQVADTELPIGKLYQREVVKLLAGR
ncbi:MAG: hypothetical protein EOO62_12885 [Hymenobacter sp.]|nr:MAG: hypothetical protein EOO62_12885 [Hymenobacter sp.]